MMRKWSVAFLVLFALLRPPRMRRRARGWIATASRGETTTLNIQSDQTSAGPDYSPLLRDFDVSGNSSSRQFELVNGVASQHMLFAVALQPRREGVLTIPSLRVGNQRTQPLTLTVSHAGRGANAWRRRRCSSIPKPTPSRLRTTGRGLHGAPVLPRRRWCPASSTRIRRRARRCSASARTRSTRAKSAAVRYTVVERHFLLIPERSGTLTIPGARFRGKAAGGFFDDLMGDGERDLHATSAPRVLGVRPAPANAPQPWLPLRELTLRYLDTPQAVRAGEAATATIQVTADGATAAQLPELQLVGEDGAQVFADAPQSDDTFSDGRPQVRLTRKFSVVPARAAGCASPARACDGGTCVRAWRGPHRSPISCCRLRRA